MVFLRKLNERAAINISKWSLFRRLLMAPIINDQIGFEFRFFSDEFFLTFFPAHFSFQTSIFASCLLFFSQLYFIFVPSVLTFWLFHLRHIYGESYPRIMFK